LPRLGEAGYVMLQYLQQRLKSFHFAIKGISTLFREEPNARIHLVITLIVLGLAYFFDIKRWEWVSLMASITLVLAAEAFNTSIEFLTDLTSPDYHPLAGKAKDMAAAAVLICATGAVIIGLYIFAPYFLELR